MNNPKMEEWERTLSDVFRIIDDRLEDKYGFLYPLHPSRPRRGKTANNAYDGLFNVGASFSAGFGSKYGRGWIVDVRMVTLSKVKKELMDQILVEVAEDVRTLLSNHYPDREIRVERDGNIFKIFGNLELSFFE